MNHKNQTTEQTEINFVSPVGKFTTQRDAGNKGFWRNTMNRPEPMTSSTGNKRIARYVQYVAAVLLATSLYGCGNSVSNGQDPSANNVVLGSAQDLTPDEYLFWTNVHQPMFRQYCRTCHEPGGSGIGHFAHRTDIKLAYSESTGRVDRTTPANSPFVLKVASGHNCWVLDVNSVPDCTASAALLASAISNWVSVTPSQAQAEQDADESNTGTTAEIDIVALLDAPTPAAPTAEQIVLGNPPVGTEFGDQDRYDFWVYSPIVSQHCQECHSANANQAQRQQPYFADTDLSVAFAAVVDNRKIDINTPANSRIYLRLAQDSHNCWTDCASNAATMLAAIQNWKNEIINNPGYSTPQVDGAGTTPISNGLELSQGQVISGGDRYRRNLVALWEFKEGNGSRVADSSGVFPAMDLILEGTPKTEPEQTDYNYAWVGGYGIEFRRGGRARATSTDASQKIFDLISPRNEYTIEAWVVPANVSQEGPAVIASYSSGNNNRNFTMGQTLYSYEFLNRNTSSGAGASNGNPTLITDPDDEDLQATQQHVVMTFDPANGRRIYVNGQFTGDVDTVAGGTLGEWNDGYLFVMGAETDGITNPWAGKIRLFAIYNRALSQEQITQNFDAGVGQKFNLLFKVGHLSTLIPDESYIWFEAAEFDSYAYLFANPRFVVLGDTTGFANISSFMISGMRIGVNGKESPVGQVFLNMNKSVDMSFGATDPKYVDLIDSAQTVVDGQMTTVPASATGTVIAQANGPNATPPDQFYLTFEQLGDQNDTRSDTTSAGALAYNYNPPVAGLTDDTYIAGIKLFEEINASMSVATGVPMTTTAVNNIYQEIQQALPGGVAMEGFLASHQIAIARLALGYCGALVDNATWRSSYFPGFPFNDAVATAFDTTAEQDIITDNLYRNIIKVDVASQPSRTETRDVLFAAGTGLLDQLVAGCSADPNCTPDANRTRTIVKSMCMTVLSSAAMTAQ